MTPLGVMVLGNHEAGQVAQCGQADRYGSDTQTIAILCRRSFRTTRAPYLTHVTPHPTTGPHIHCPRLSPCTYQTPPQPPVNPAPTHPPVSSRPTSPLHSP